MVAVLPVSLYEMEAERSATLLAWSLPNVFDCRKSSIARSWPVSNPNALLSMG